MTDKVLDLLLSTDREIFRPRNANTNFKRGICACMGPGYGEPYCYCTMMEKGIPLNEAARELARIESEKQFAAIDWGKYEDG